ncbi:hypothetical protein BC936DRAFT_137643 [Jimgerdemannia flammicorona]|uniref:MACPF-like domain-containing protein n=1 Tax=Jimgerdemannia flammicorona TaxID=994334 RepID=A0A433DIX1_9FUNG|nr:hypothetical protein BC936DRAFT_137643 [Jimgerdemannia flammicorona]
MPHNGNGKQRNKTLSLNTKEYSIATFQRLGMGKAITTHWKPAPSAAFKINPDNPPLFEGPLHNITQEDLVCHTLWTKTFVENHMSSAAAELCGPLVSAELHGNEDDLNERGAYGSLKHTYHTETIIKAKVSLKKQNVLLEEDFRNALVKALAKVNRDEKRAPLKEVLTKFGYFWPVNLSLGGKDRTTTSSVNRGKKTAQKTSHETRAGLRAKSDGSLVGIGVSGAFESIAGSTSASGQVSESQKSLKMGGDPNLQSPEWKGSVNDPASWAIVDRDGVVPIWEMLDDDLGRDVEAVINATFNSQNLLLDQTYTIKNLETENYLSWKNYYYNHDGAGKIIVTAPEISGEKNEKIKWKFVPKNKDKKYLRYDDEFYLQPSTSKNDQYLHASSNHQAPVSKSYEGQVSLRRISGPEFIQTSDVWTIERSNDTYQDNHQDARNIDALMRRTAFVQKADVFRLKCSHKSYLGSHRVCMKDLRVKEKFAIKCSEVIMIPEERLDSEKAMWKIGTLSRLPYLDDTSKSHTWQASQKLRDDVATATHHLPSLPRGGM